MSPSEPCSSQERSTDTPGSTSSSCLPRSYGVLLIPGFDILDVFGPLAYVNSLQDATVHLIAESSMDPVWSFTLHAGTTIPGFPHGIGQLVVPTHTIATAPPLDVLIVVGGPGTRTLSDGGLKPCMAFIRERYPSLKYLLSICTGNALAAASGVLDDRHATGNKRSWQFVTAQGPNVHWVPKARWVVDGNSWSSSGVESGTDMIFSFVAQIYGQSTAQSIANALEHIPHTDSTFDPFSDIYNTGGTLIPPKPAPPVPAGAPSKFGVLVYPGFSSLEAWGALEMIYANPSTRNVWVIAADLTPVTSNVLPGSDSLPFFQKRGQAVVPDFNLENVLELDVLVVPGAPGIPNDPKLALFIANQYPNLRYLISVGTGAALVAQSCVSKGHEATTAKPFFDLVKREFDEVDWKHQARWVVSDSGKLWSSSGGAAVLDTLSAFLSETVSPEGAAYTDTMLEYLPSKDPKVDPFANVWTGETC